MLDSLIGPLCIILFLLLMCAFAYCLKTCLEWIVKLISGNCIRRRSTVINVLVIEVEPAQDREQLVPKKNATPDLQAPSAEDSDLAQQEKQTELSERCDNLMHLLEGTGENINFSF
ncbi:uncharacterized protein LOC109423277 [Aedes albopictus]|uniref:Secreted protein n=1 Tax=Aedes albopictus TaxID=7160 RepID=A0ABM1YA51_AEDAL